MPGPGGASGSVVTAQRKEHLNCFQGTIIFPLGAVGDFKVYVSLVSVCENVFSWFLFLLGVWFLLKPHAQE